MQKTFDPLGTLKMKMCWFIHSNLEPFSRIKCNISKYNDVIQKLLKIMRKKTERRYQMRKNKIRLEILYILKPTNSSLMDEEK